MPIVDIVVVGSLLLAAIWFIFFRKDDAPKGGEFVKPQPPVQPASEPKPVVEQEVKKTRAPRAPRGTKTQK